MPNLNIDLAGVQLKNPVMVASGTYGYGREFESFYDPALLGAIVVKGTTLEPKAGNLPPRIMETPAGMLNAIGLQNDGVEVLCSQHLPYLHAKGIPAIVNFSGNTVEQYCAVASRLDKEPVAALEANISCPNVKKGGMQFGADIEVAANLVREIKRVTSLPLIVKLSPNVTDIVAMARAVESAGADALALINTLVGMAINVKTRRPYLSTYTGGLSGPAIKPVAVRMVWQVAKAVSIPIIGMGGIATAADAIEFFLAGASAVSIGTANFVDPMAAVNVISGIETYMTANGFSTINELRGALLEP